MVERVRQAGDRDWPLVSVVIPTHQRFELCKDTILSARQQTYEPLEIIVVEDGSDSGVEAWLKDERLDRVRYVRHRENKGLAATRNTGLRLSKGRYVAFLDDDDGWLPDKIALQMEVVQAYAGEKCLVYCGGCMIDSGEIVSESIPTASGLMSNFVYRGYTLDSSSMLVARDALLGIGGFSEDLASCVDHDIWMKMAHAGFVMDFVPRALVVYRDHPHSQMTSRLVERLQGIEQFFQKWKPVVIAECGVSCWQAIEEVYHLQTMRTIRSQYRNGAINKQIALGYLDRLFAMQSQSFTWADYVAFRTGRLSYTPVRSNLLKIAKGTATYPFRQLGRRRRHAFSNPD